MNSREYLFPDRLTRRDFLKLAGAGAAGAALGGCATEAERPELRIGSGYHTYEALPEWGKLPAGMKYGWGCGVVVDAKDRAFVLTRSENPCVVIFDRHGNILETWSNDFAQRIGYTPKQVTNTAHGLYLSREGDSEFLYWTENSTGKKPPVYGARVYKTDLHGKVLHTIGQVKEENSASQKFDFTNPTDVAVAPNGDIYIVDGYGSQLVYRFDGHFNHIKTIGGPGNEHGQFNTCHGIWINTLRREPEVYIADRQNRRIEVYSLELEYKRTLFEGEVRNPCCFYQFKDKLYIPDLANRVTIVDAEDRIVTHLGDGKDHADNETNPLLFGKPHSLSVDSRGDFYVVEWLDFGRPRKFRHTPQSA